MDAISDREIVSTRVFDAPREAVFDAFRDPVQLAQWWGPKDFTSTFQEFDLRPGGVWRFIMHGPDDTDYPNEKRFVEVMDHERIAFRHEEPHHNFLMTMKFMDVAGGTKLVWEMRFDSAAECAGVRRFVVPANEENFDRLATHLARRA